MLYRLPSINRRVSDDRTRSSVRSNSLYSSSPTHEQIHSHSDRRISVGVPRLLPQTSLDWPRSHPSTESDQQEEIMTDEEKEEPAKSSDVGVKEHELVVDKVPVDKSVSTARQRWHDAFERVCNQLRSVS